MNLDDSRCFKLLFNYPPIDNPNLIIKLSLQIKETLLLKFGKISKKGSRKNNDLIVNSIDSINNINSSKKHDKKDKEENISFKNQLNMQDCKIDKTNFENSNFQSNIISESFTGNDNKNSTLNNDIIRNCYGNDNINSNSNSNISSDKIQDNSNKIISDSLFSKNHERLKIIYEKVKNLISTEDSQELKDIISNLELKGI